MEPSQTFQLTDKSIAPCFSFHCLQTLSLSPLHAEYSRSSQGRSSPCRRPQAFLKILFPALRYGKDCESEEIRVRKVIVVAHDWVVREQGLHLVPFQPAIRCMEYSTRHHCILNRVCDHSGLIYWRQDRITSTCKRREKPKVYRRREQGILIYHRRRIH